MTKDHHASPCAGPMGACDAVVGGLHAFPSILFTVGLRQQAAGSQGSVTAQGIVFAVLGTVVPQPCLLVIPSPTCGPPFHRLLIIFPLIAWFLSLLLLLAALVSATLFSVP